MSDASAKPPRTADSSVASPDASLNEELSSAFSDDDDTLLATPPQMSHDLASVPSGNDFLDEDDEETVLIHRPSRPQALLADASASPHLPGAKPERGERAYRAIQAKGSAAALASDGAPLSPWETDVTEQMESEIDAALLGVSSSATQPSRPPQMSRVNERRDHLLADSATRPVISPLPPPPSFSKSIERKSNADDSPLVVQTNFTADSKPPSEESVGTTLTGTEPFPLDALTASDEDSDEQQSATVTSSMPKHLEASNTPVSLAWRQEIDALPILPPAESAQLFDAQDATNVDDGSLGRLVIDAPADAIVFVDGVDKGTGVVELVGISRFARFAVRVHQPRHRPWSANVSLRGAPAARVRPDLPSRS